jgi:hypothetical protein
MDFDSPEAELFGESSGSKNKKEENDCKYIRKK